MGRAREVGVVIETHTNEVGTLQRHGDHRWSVSCRFCPWNFSARSTSGAAPVEQRLADHIANHHRIERQSALDWTWNESRPG